MSTMQVIRGQNVDDDGQHRRTGTLMTVTAHIITAVIGSGVLSLAWSVAQLGWIAGPTVLLGFAIITYFTSTLLADLYRSPDGTRNRTYTAVVRSTLGGHKVIICGIAQYLNLIGVTIGYTLTASISLVAVEKSICFHKKGHGTDVSCSVKMYPFMILFACIQIILSQVPNFHKLSWLSVLAAVMSFAYSTICLGLSIAKLAGGGDMKDTSLTPMLGNSEQVWKTFQAIGNIAFAYAFSTILTEIQDTLKSGPAENVVMRKASLAGVSTTTLFYVLCGCTGYAAFGVGAPGNFLTDFGFYEPYWLIAFANICVSVHLIGAYQVFCQPLFSFVETKCNERWPDINIERRLRVPYFGAAISVNFFRLVWRSVYVMAATLVAAKLPFFNQLLGLVGAASFYPLTVYFPIEMHISRSRIPRFSRRWIWLNTLSLACLAVSVVALAGSIRGIIRKIEGKSDP